MYDQVSEGHTDKADIARSWFSGFFSERILKQDTEGRPLEVPLYYDPDIDRTQGKGIFMGLGVAWYVLPFDRELAYRLYEAAVKEMGAYSDPYDAEGRAPRDGGSLMLQQLALCLAVEFGEADVEARLREATEDLAEPRTFGDGDFGFFYHLLAPWPRGQPSALRMVAEVNSVGGWQRVFNNPNYRGRFAAPSVVKVDFPRLGLSQAWNDPSAGTLTISTYAATPSRVGESTAFTIVQVPSAKEVRISCDGQPYTDWVALGESSLSIRTTIAEHTFVVHTGYHGPTGVEIRASSNATRSKL